MKTGCPVASPRPQTIRTELGRTLVAMEVPACACRLRLRKARVTVVVRGRHGSEHKYPAWWPVGDRCRHAAAADHDVPADKWLDLLVKHDRAGMAERPAPEPAIDPALCHDRDARVRLYEARAAAGLGLFHPLDSHQVWGIES